MMRRRAVCGKACAPTPKREFQGNLTCIDDRQLDGASVNTVLDVVPCDYFFIAAARTMTDPEHPILTVGNGEEELGAKPGRTFRIIPS